MRFATLGATQTDGSKRGLSSAGHIGPETTKYSLIDFEKTVPALTATYQGSSNTRRSLVKDKPEKETPSSEVTALCTLLARILYRGLAQHDPRVLALLSPPEDSPKPQKGGNPNDHAA
jgi:hypothetical protein